MSDHYKLLSVLTDYAKKYSYIQSLEKMLMELSFDTQHEHYVYDSKYKNFKAISLDDLAQNAYRKAKIPESNKIEDSVASVDACVISNESEWFLIEFKNQKISSTNRSSIKKAFQTWHMLMDILYECDDSRKIFPDLYENPIKYAQNNVKYVLVFDELADPKSTEKVHEAKLAKMHYVPEGIYKIGKYLYNDAYAITAPELEKLMERVVI